MVTINFVIHSQNEYYRTRTQDFAVEVVRMCDSLPKTMASSVMAKQILRSASSMSINYRAVCIARSKAEKFSKLSIVVEEADETVGWLEMIMACNLITGPKMDALHQEAIELSKIFSTYRATIKKPLPSAESTNTQL